MTPEQPVVRSGGGILLPPELAHVAKADAAMRLAGEAVPQNVIDLPRPASRILISTQQKCQFYGHKDKGFVYQLILESAEANALDANDAISLEQFSMELRTTPTTPEAMAKRLVERFGQRPGVGVGVQGVVVTDSSQTNYKIVFPPLPHPKPEEKTESSPTNSQ